MSAAESERLSERVLVAAPVGRDAAVIQQMLAQAGIPAECCAGLEDLARAIDDGAGAVVFTEESLTPPGLSALLESLARQPTWSDLPLIVLTSGSAATRKEHDATSALEARTNVTLIERPVRVRTLVTAAQAALRARRRQYETRALLAREQDARRAAEDANRIKDEFVTTVSHELRTPLTAILGWSRMLVAGRIPEDQRARALATIDRNARAQAQLVDDLLDFSRILSGKLRLTVAPVDFAAVAEAALESVRPSADAKGVALAADIDPGAGTVSGDAARLQQVAWNLLTNAVKFTPAGGRVAVALRGEPGHAVLSVSDSGQGIAAEFLPYVFDRFRQADGSITRAHGGLGLGLSIVKHLVEQHGGRVEARSDGVGSGATFTVRVPLIPGAALAPADDTGRPSIEVPPPGAMPALDGVHVLAVDDEPDARELIRTMLEQCSARVTTAASAAEAFERLCADRPDVLVSDLGMPDEDGYALIRRVRALPADRGGRTPAVALTAYARADDRTRALLAGFGHHVAKPVDPHEIAVVVASLVGRAVS